jgi:hypothetical protein
MELESATIFECFAGDKEKSMDGQAASQSAYEQALLSIVHTLPVERVLQILDYARYVQMQANEDFGFLDDDESEEVQADEALWDAQFANSQHGLKKMADKVRADISAGRTSPMVFTKDGSIKPGLSRALCPTSGSYFMTFRLPSNRKLIKSIDSGGRIPPPEVCDSSASATKSLFTQYESD